jgi:hypothetical protein
LKGQICQEKVPLVILKRSSQSFTYISWFVAENIYKIVESLTIADEFIEGACCDVGSILIPSSLAKINEWFWFLYSQIIPK